MLSRDLMLSCQALSRSAHVVSQRTSAVAAHDYLDLSSFSILNFVKIFFNQNFIISYQQHLHKMIVWQLRVPWHLKGLWQT